MIQELVDQEHIIGNHLLNPQEWEEATLTEIWDLKKSKNSIIVEKEQLWDDKDRLEKAYFDAYQEVPVIEEDLDASSKSQKLGQIITGFKRDMMDL